MTILSKKSQNENVEISTFVAPVLGNKTCLLATKKLKINRK